MQKEKVHIDCEKGAQISILANKIATRWWPNFIIKEPKQTIHYICISFSRYHLISIYYLFFVIIKKLGLLLMVVSVLLKMKIGHAQISVPKIGIPMLKLRCINPWLQSCKKYRTLNKRVWSRPDLRSIYQFGGHLNLDAKLQVR